MAVIYRHTLELEVVATYRRKLGQAAAGTCSSKPELEAAETCSNKVGGKELVYGIPHKAS